MAMLISPNTINQGRILNTNGDGSGATLLGTTPVVYKIATNGCNAAKLLIDVVSATGVAVTFVFVDGSAVTDAGLMTEGAQLLSTAASTGTAAQLHTYATNKKDVIECPLFGAVRELWIGVFADQDTGSDQNTAAAELSLVEG